jgi:hypothetical protein
MTAAAARLQALVDAEVLAPDLADEIRRLYEIEDTHEHTLLELAELRRDNHRTAVLNGELRERLVRAERRLEDLPLAAITEARRAAYLLGEGFVRIRHHSRGRFTGDYLATERVTVRRGD